MPSTTDLKVYEGSDEEVLETIKRQAPGDTAAVLLDLTDYDVEFLIKDSSAVADDDPANTLLSTVTGEITKLDQATNKGQCVVSIPRAIIPGPVTRYRAVWLIEKASGKRHPLLYGKFTVADT